jgi:hypothetical protein
MQNQNKRTLTVQEDPLTGDLFLEFPEDLMEQMGWVEGDELIWGMGSEDGWPVTLRKKDTNDASSVDQT